jgi:3-methylfumaryl-CoA hydratase
MATNEKPFADWIGRTSEAEDIVTPRLVESFRATFGMHLAPVGESEAPLGIHWCLSPAIVPMDALGPDGHPAKNLFLPPIPQPRRMWAGGVLEYHAPLLVGDVVRRDTTIGDIARKQGRSGELWFVAVHHDYSTARGLALRERHDIVYREAAKPAVAGGAENDAGWKDFDDQVEGAWVVETSSTLLFRYSAMTFNGHRIHYDLPYATGVEGYAGLVVHGPVQATLLYNLAASTEGRPPARFEYRGLSPAIAGHPIRVRRSAGRGNVYLVEGVAGAVHMEARVDEKSDGHAS